jgi:HD superfamily phosphohydrolase
MPIRDLNLISQVLSKAFVLIRRSRSKATAKIKILQKSIYQRFVVRKELDMLNFVDTVRDPVWGSIPITDIESRIINTNIFKRLRGVRQMSFAFISFSGANHTRFEHSIGTMHVAYTMATSIKGLSDKLYRKGVDDFDEANRALQFLRISALLHDLGHPPFSHAIENVFKKNPNLSSMGEKYSHDTYTEQLIQNNPEIRDIMETSLPFPLDKIAQLATGNEGGFEGNTFYSRYKIFLPIISGDIDADKIDYILRDNYHCGLPSGLELAAICDSLTMDESGTRISLKPGKVTSVETLLTDRLRLIRDIHHDKNNRIANQMLMRSVAGFLSNKQELDRRETVRKMHEEWNDFDMHRFLFSEMKIEKESPKDFEINKSANETYKIFARDVFKGELLSEVIELKMTEIHPDIRYGMFIVNQDPKHILSIQNRLEEMFKAKLILDFCFINPPPLTLELDKRNGERRDSFLFNVSSIIRGVLQDSFNKSFVALYVYKDSSPLEAISLEGALDEEILKEAEFIRNSLISRGKLMISDVILSVLEGIKEFESKNFSDCISVWVYTTSGLQKFVGSVMNSNQISCSKFNGSKLDTGSFDIPFFREIEKLASCGLMDQSKNTIRHKDGYSVRNDYRINSYGHSYYLKYLSNKEACKKIVDYVCKKQIESLNDIEDAIKLNKDAYKSTEGEYQKFFADIKKLRDRIKDNKACVLTV